MRRAGTVSTLGTVRRAGAGGTLATVRRAGAGGTLATVRRAGAGGALGTVRCAGGTLGAVTDLRRAGAVAVLITLTATLALGTAHAAAPLEPVLGHEKTYSETFTLLVDLGEGRLFEVELMVSNLGIGEGHGACRALLAGAGNATDVTRYVSRAEWGSGPDGLHIGPCRLAVTPGGLAATVDLPGLSGEVVLERGLDPAPSASRRLEVKGGYFEHEVLLRSAAARAHVSGCPAAGCAGTSMLDHFRVTALPGKLARTWLRLWAPGPRGPTLLWAREPPGGGVLDGWLWTPTNEAPRPLLGARLQWDGTGGVDLVRVSGINLEAGGGAGGETGCHLGPAVHRHAPLEDLGVLGFFARLLLGNPVTRTFRTSACMGTAGWALFTRDE